MSRWFRHYAGMMRDEKLVRVAITSKQPIERVVWVWGAILESAAEIDDNGRYDVDAAEIAYFLRSDLSDIEAILSGLDNAARIADGYVVKWGDRQYKSDRSAERQAAYRERKRAENRHADGGEVSRDDVVTSLSRHGDAPETETETETKKDSSLRSERARLHNGFDEWWAVYPHKVGKGAAEKAYRTARKTADVEILRAGVERYVRQKPPDRALCNPATWLNQRRWEDAPADLLAQPASAPKGEMVTLRNGKEILRNVALRRCAQFFTDRRWNSVQVFGDCHPPDHPNTVYPQEIVEEAKRLAREAA